MSNSYPRKSRRRCMGSACFVVSSCGRTLCFGSRKRLWRLRLNSPASPFPWPGGVSRSPLVCIPKCHPKSCCVPISSTTILLLPLIEGTFGLCSGLLGQELHLPFFDIIATIVTVCVLLLWVMVASLTVVEGWKGRIFYAPCLSAADRIVENPVPDEPVGNRLPLVETSRQSSDR